MNPNFECFGFEFSCLFFQSACFDQKCGDEFVISGPCHVVNVG